MVYSTEASNGFRYLLSPEKSLGRSHSFPSEHWKWSTRWCNPTSKGGIYFLQWVFNIKTKNNLCSRNWKLHPLSHRCSSHHGHTTYVPVLLLSCCYWTQVSARPAKNSAMGLPGQPGLWAGHRFLFLKEQAKSSPCCYALIEPHSRKRELFNFLQKKVITKPSLLCIRKMLQILDYWLKRRGWSCFLPWPQFWLEHTMYLEQAWWFRPL